MTGLTTYKLLPPGNVPPDNAATLSFHFGHQGIGIEEAGETLPSDSLFAALVAQAAHLDGARLDAEGTLAFAQPFVTGTPPFVLSSLFPRLGELLLLPRPSLPLVAPEPKQTWWDEIGKGFKKLRYLSPRLFADVCAGRPFTDAPIIMQGGKVWITPTEAATLPKPWAQESRESPSVWRQRLAAKDHNIWEIEQVSRVTVDRVTNASAYYKVGRVTYAPGAGLAFVVRFNDATARAGFVQLLDVLAESGLGGRRSSGYGAFRWAGGPELTLDLGRPGGRAVLLSRYLPRDEELAFLRHDHAAYKLERVGGWVYSQGRPSQRRQRIMMVTEGSVLHVGDATVRGRVEDVAPNYRKSRTPHPLFKRGAGTAHPVYRSGLALALPIPDTKEERS